MLLYCQNFNQFLTCLIVLLFLINIISIFYEVACFSVTIVNKIGMVDIYETFIKKKRFRRIHNLRLFGSRFTRQFKIGKTSEF